MSEHMTLDMFPGTADSTALFVPVPGWIPDRFQFPDQSVLDDLVPVQGMVRSYQQALQNHQQNIQQFQVAVQHIRQACSVLSSSVQVWQAVDTAQNQQAVQQAIDAIRLSAQNLVRVGMDFRTSRQQVINLEQQIQQTISEQTNLDSRLKQEIRLTADQKQQVLKQAIQAEQNHQQAQAEIRQAVQQTNLLIHSRQGKPQTGSAELK